MAGSSVGKMFVLLLSVLVTITAFATSTSSSGSNGNQMKGEGNELPPVEPERPNPPRLQEQTVSNGLNENGMKTIVVSTTDLDVLKEFLTAHKVSGVDAALAFPLPIITVPASLVDDISRLNGVLEVSEYTPPVFSDVKRDDSVGPNMKIVSDHHGIADAHSKGYFGDNVSVAIIDTGVDFASLDLQGTQARVTDPSSPYYGWPIAFDPKSMSTYLKEGHAEDTWYANTTLNGTNNFPVTHRIEVDGKTDFGVQEIWADDKENDVTHILPDGSPSYDFDVSQLYITRDTDFWYFGIRTNDGMTNKTFGIYIDVDNATSGGDYDPLGKHIDTVASHSNSIADAEYSPNGSLIASASKDSSIKIWRTDGKLLHVLKGYSTELHSVTWSPDGMTLASAEKNYIYFWDPLTGKRKGDPIHLPFAISGKSLLSFNGNGTWIAVCGGTTNYSLLIYDVTTGNQVGYIRPKVPYQSTSIAFNPSSHYGDRLAAGFRDNNIRVYRVNGTNLNNKSGAVPEKTFTGHTGDVLSIAWSPDGSKMVSGASEQNVKVWDFVGSNATVDLQTGSARVNSVDWSVRGEIAAGDFNGKVTLWDSSQNKIGSFQASLMEVNCVDFSPAENRLISAAQDTDLKQWDFAGNYSTFFNILPDYIIYANYTSTYWGFDEEGFPWSLNDTFENATFFEWNGSGWVGNRLIDIGGKQKYKGVVSEGIVDSGLLEMAVPRESLGDPPGFSVELFSVGKNESHAQDTAPSDVNVAFAKTDWDPTLWTSLSNFVYRKIQLYRVNLSAENQSKSGNYHFGNHPDENLMREYGTIGVLVVDSQTEGVYDKVYVDLNNDKVFDERDPVVYKGHEIAYLDNFNTTAAEKQPPDLANITTPDGYPDISGGMIYFIADGKNGIPYSDVYVDRLKKGGDENAKNIIPGNGELVAFMGELSFQANHGTRSASAVVSQGRLDPNITGVAPKAKIISVGNALTNVFESWYFSIVGYDGKVGTGDEAQVVLNGFNFPLQYGDGWDFYSRYADWVTAKKGNNTVFVVSAGNDGFGYGTVNSPSSSTGVISVGVAEDWTRFSNLSGGVEGANIHYGDVSPYSSRGPTPLGNPKPDVIAIGEAHVAEPLWASVGDGSKATTKWTSIWKGSSVSCAIAGGVMALIFEAYRDYHPSYPSVEEAKMIMMSGADDIDHDILSQGAGFINASRAVDLASSTSGLLVSPSFWTPGNFKGRKYKAFPVLMSEGDEDYINLTIENRGSISESVQVSAGIFRKTAEYSMSATSKFTLWYSGDWRLPFWMNGTGLYKLDPNPAFQNYTIRRVDIDRSKWESADLVQVTAYANFTDVDVDRNGKIEGGSSADAVSVLRLEDWQDVKNTFPYPHPYVERSEINTISECWNTANILEARMHHPASRVHDALVMDLVPAPDKGRNGIFWTIKVELLKRVTWDWIAFDKSNLSIAGHGSDAFKATISVPSGVGIGSYEGAIYVSGAGQVVVIPVLVNVASSQMRFHFGGYSTVSQDLYNNTRIFGGVGGGFPGDLSQSGDWRFFYLDVPSQGEFSDPHNYKLYVDVSWERKPTDIDLFVFGKGANPPSGNYNDYSRYGPYTLAQTGHSEFKDEFLTITNESEEIITPLLKPGLNVIALHDVIFNGTKPYETIFGDVGWIKISPVEVKKVTNQRRGSLDVSFVTNFPWPSGMQVAAVGPASIERYEDIEIPFDKKCVDDVLNGDITFIDALACGSYTLAVKVKDALIFDVHIWGHDDSPDLDLGIFLDANGDGEAQSGEFVKYDADADADEHVKLTSPEDGQYVIKVLGYNTMDPGHFDIEVSITIAGVEGYKIARCPTGAIQPHTVNWCTMTWNFTGKVADRDYGGVISMGPPEAPKAILIPVTISLDRQPPVIRDFAVGSVFKQVNFLDNITTNDLRPTLQATFTDSKRGELAADTIEVFLDGEDVTPWAMVNVEYTPNAEGVYGYWIGSFQYAPLTPLKEGFHNVTVIAGDIAGNLQVRVYSLIIDSTAPPLVLNLPKVIYTREHQLFVGGYTERGATVRIRSAILRPDDNGYFGTNVDLVDGENIIRVGSVDWFAKEAGGELVPGNEASVELVVISDSIPPTLERISPLSGTFVNKQTVMISGQVSDLMALPSVFSDFTTLSLRINGVETPVTSDGGFELLVSLDNEGPNAIELSLSDPSGNVANDTITIYRDTTAPVLTLDPMKDVVSNGRITVGGVTEKSATVTINGRLVGNENGRFSEEVELSPGANTIVISARDNAGNVEAITRVIEYAPSHVDYLGVLMFVIFLVVGLFAGFFFGRRFKFRPEEGPTEEEIQVEEAAEEEEELEETPREIETSEMPIEEETTVETQLEEEVDQTDRERKIQRLQRAFEEGKISRKIYEENLEKITRDN